MTDCAGACGRSACVAAAGQSGEQHEPRPRATSEEQMQINADVTQARETHVTGYAEHRGSLNDKKRNIYAHASYRRRLHLNTQPAQYPI